MKKALLFLLVVTASFLMHAQSPDSIYFKRPYYIGFTTGYSAYFDGVLGHHGPDHYMGPFDSQRTYWGASYGILLAVPFARKMETEIAVQGNYWKERRTRVNEVYYLPNVIPYEISGFDYDTYWSTLKNVTLRLQFSYEFLRNRKMALNAGVAGWSGFGQQGVNNDNDLGSEFVVKSYVNLSRGSALQPSLAIGMSGSGTYIAARCALMLIGSRYYSKEKAMKYYVKTYED